jgi:DNA repair exonuclease SbcCD ATPase subunit
MASVDWCKATTQKAGGMIRHCGEKERIEVNHSNKDIDKSKSHLNIYIGADDYEPMLDKVEARIDEVDKENPPERDLGDKRVTCILLYTPVPQAIADKGKAKEFLQDAHKLFEDFFGAENVGGTCGHFDEVHKYIDKNGKETDSLIHGHTIVAAYAEWTEDVKKSVKQENGRYKQVKTGETRERKGINGKNSVTKERMTKLNKAIDKMCMEKYGISYNTGMGAEKKQTEVLKHESLVRSNEQLQGQIEKHKEHIEDLQGQMGRLSQTVEDLTEQVEQLTTENDKLRRQALDYQFEPKGRFEPQSHYDKRRALFEVKVGVEHTEKENARTAQNNANAKKQLDLDRAIFEEWKRNEEKRLHDEKEETARKTANIDAEITNAARKQNRDLLAENAKLTEQVGALTDRIDNLHKEIRLDKQEIAELNEEIEQLKYPQQSYGYGLKM